MLEFGAVALLLVGVAVAVGACLVVKALLWVVLLPVRLLVAIVTVPFLILKVTFGIVAFLLVTPLLGLAVLAGLFAIALGLLA